MNPLLASTALGLVAAWPVGALGFGLGRLVERLTDDPRPRAAAWSLAYALPAGALAATVALTFAPTPRPPPSTMTIEVAAAPAAVHADTPTAVASPPTWTPEAELTENLAWGLVGLSVAGLLARGARWTLGRRRLAAIRAAAEPCQDYALVEAVRVRAARLGVKPPRVRVSAEVSEPLLAGARRPVILLPKTLAEANDATRLELVCGHELAHLKRGDNWRIPAEEALAGLFWMAPPVAALRGRMLAAREAVCDAAALDGAAPDARRDYARVLVDALRMNAAPAPQLAFGSAFTGRERTLARMRLSAILQPSGHASALRVGLVFALGGALTVATGFGSFALADQARRIAPLALSDAEKVRAEAAADAMAANAVEATQAVPPKDVAAAPQARAMTMRAAEAAPAAPAAEAIATVAPVAEVAPVASLTPAPPISPAPLSPKPVADLRPAPDPHPDPHPNPRPNPQPNPRVARDISVNVDDRQKASIEIRADRQEQAQNATVYLGDVSLRGQLNPVLVNLQVNGRAAPSNFSPTDLARGAIERLEVTSRDVSVDRKMTVNVVLKGATR